MKFEQHVEQANLIAIVQSRAARDSPAVDIRAVQAVEVFDVEAIRFAKNSRMLPRHTPQRNHHVAIRIAPELNLRAEQFEGFAGALAVKDTEIRHIRSSA